MALAVKTMPETKTEARASGLIMPSVLGAVYVYVALAILISGLPRVWATQVAPWLTEHTNSFVSAAGLIAAELLAGIVFIIIGSKLMGGRSTPGVKAGTF